MTLLDKALAHRTTDKLKHVSVNIDEEVDLAIAWAQGKITPVQLITALGKKGTHGNANHLYSFVATRLREGIRSGRIKVK